ncbi:MAG TPA: hypothetical protein VFF00_07285 [Candidatus Elarobacter sp.]|nr:hypothetical protein [Candidatus Elarobacter sp.]
MAAVRYLYLLHVREVRCGHCGTAVVDASSARPQLRVAVGAHERPIRLPALDALPAPVLMSLRCACGRDVFYGAPADAVPLLSDRPPQTLTAPAKYVLAGA